MKKSTLAAFWSPFHGQTGQTAGMAAIGTFIGANYSIYTLLTHSQFTKSNLENAFILPEKDIETLLFDEKGIDAIEKLARTKQLSEKNFTDYTSSLIPGRLEMLLGTNKSSREAYAQIIETLPYIIACARQSYDLILCDVNSGADSGITGKVLEGSDIAVVFLNQNLEVLKSYFEDTGLHPQIEKSRHILVLGNYDPNSKYTVKHIKRMFGYKDEIYTIPRNAEFLDAHNDHDLISFFFANSSPDNDDDNSFFISEVEKVSKRVLSEMKVDAQLYQKTIKKQSLLDMLNIFSRKG